MACRYHNHANYAGFHRADRSPVPKVLALPGDFRGDDLDVIAALQGFSDRNSLEFRRDPAWLLLEARRGVALDCRP